MAVAFDPNRPIYIQIMDEIKKRVVRGVYAPGEKLPSVRDLAKEIAVNPNTIARVYMELERESFIVTRRGQGTFLTEDMTLIERERDRFITIAVGKFIEEITSLSLDEKQAGRLMEVIWAESEKITGTTGDTARSLV